MLVGYNIFSHLLFTAKFAEQLDVSCHLHFDQLHLHVLLHFRIEDILHPLLKLKIHGASPFPFGDLVIWLKVGYITSQDKVKVFGGLTVIP